MFGGCYFLQNVAIKWGLLSESESEKRGNYSENWVSLTVAIKGANNRCDNQKIISFSLSENKTLFFCYFKWQSEIAYTLCWTTARHRHNTQYLNRISNFSSYFFYFIFLHKRINHMFLPLLTALHVVDVVCTISFLFAPFDGFDGLCLFIY